MNEADTLDVLEDSLMSGSISLYHQQEDVEGDTIADEEYDSLKSVSLDVPQAEEENVVNNRKNTLWNSSTSTGISYRDHIQENPIVAIHLLNLIMITMFIVSMGLNNWKFESLYKNPLLGPSAEALSDAGAKHAYKIIDKHEIWRLFMANLLHVGVVHLFINCNVLWVVGAVLEPEYGPFKVLAIFFLSGISGFTLSCALLPDTLTAGSSAGIFGLVAALLLDIFHNYAFIDKPQVAAFQICCSVCVMLFLGLLPFVDNFAHIGGFVAGVFLSAFLLGHSRLYQFYSPTRQKARKLLTIVSVLFTVIWFAFLFTLLFDRNVSADTCKWCSKINCLDISIWSCDTRTTCSSTLPDGSVVTKDLKNCY